MKKFILITIVAVFLSCNNNSKTHDSATEVTEGDLELTIQEKIAKANGLDAFENSNEIQFAFNVKVGDSLRTKRLWNWNLKTNTVTLTEKDSTKSFNRNNDPNEQQKIIDQKFINDSYWLLFPFQLVWSDAEITEGEMSEAPISKQKMHQLTASYNSDGGYTPGDTYEVFYNDDYMIQEWIYKSADGKSQLASTWEDYENFEGIMIAKSHKSPDRNFELFFTDLEVK